MELHFRQTGNRQRTSGHFALHAVSPADPTLRYVILDRINASGYEVRRLSGPIKESAKASTLVAKTFTISAAKVDAQIDHDAFIYI